MNERKRLFADFSFLLHSVIKNSILNAKRKEINTDIVRISKNLSINNVLFKDRHASHLKTLPKI